MIKKLGPNGAKQHQSTPKNAKDLRCLGYDQRCLRKSGRNDDAADAADCIVLLSRLPLMLRIIALLLIAGVVSCPGQDASEGLSNYVGRDLRKLSTNEMASLCERFKAMTGEDLGEKWGWRSLEPWGLFAYASIDAAWVLVEAYPGYDIPDASEIKLHFFAKSWARTCKHSFPTGYRFFLDSVTVQKRPELNRPLIVAKVTSSGPFITSPGPKRPAFEQGNYQLQYYALSGTNLFLVRLEDNQGILARNPYQSRMPFKGPAVPQRTKEQWVKFLDSSNAVEQLATLAWLTGSHLSSSEERKVDHNQESVEDSRIFEVVRDDVRTKSILRKLEKSRNKWIAEYAALGVEY